jgi:formate dehydrogenase accessory protein FdhE
MGSARGLKLSNFQKRWDARIDRARELQKSHFAAAAPLRFYELVLVFQREMAKGCRSDLRSEAALREQIEIDSVAANFHKLLEVAMQHGPEGLSSRARQLQQAKGKSWEGILQAGLQVGETGLSALDGFFARACLQPVAEELQLQLPVEANYSKNLCPACDGLPQLAILRPEGEGASRWLLCSFCLREWLFRRLVCPWCGEEDKEKLPRFSAEQCANVLVESCDTCKRYLKAVDMTIDGHAEPLVDEAAVAVLDVWAYERGYTKVVPNLIGF